MNLRSLNDIGLKWKLTIPFLFLAITGAILLFVVLYKFQDNLIHINEAKRLNNQYQFFLNDIVCKRNMAMGLAYLSAQNPEVAEAFTFRDRDRLIQLLQPAYQTLLNESEKTYRTLIENVPIIVYMLMPDGTMVFLNRGVRRCLARLPGN